MLEFKYYESRNFVGGVVFSVYDWGGDWVLYCAHVIFVEVYDKVPFTFGGVPVAVCE